MTKIHFLIIFFFALLFSNAHSTIFYYKTKEGDRIENIFKAYFQTNYSGNEIVEYDIDSKKFAEDLKLVNPQVADWQNIKSGTVVLIPSINLKKPKLSMGFYYTASQGNFKEILTETSSVAKSSQVSPVTFGAMSQFQLTGSNFVIPASVYFATLNSGTLTLTGETEQRKISIPNEYGATLYTQYSIPYSQFSPYAGLDYEKLTTFNMVEIQNAEPVAFRQNSFIYLTAGAGYNLKLTRYRIYLKASVSKTLYSSSSTLKTSDEFNGYRELLYFNIKKHNSPYVFHAFYKHHNLTGPTKLTIDRFGIGLGYFIF